MIECNGNDERTDGKMSKKISASAAVTLIITVVCLVASLCLGVLASKKSAEPHVFADAENSYAKDELIALYRDGIITGDPDGENIDLHPQSAVTRGEFVETLVRFFGISVEYYNEEYITYPDYPKLSQGVKSALSALSHYSLTDGVFPLAGYFSEDRAVTRREAALCIGKLISGSRLDFDFTDMDEVPVSVAAQISGLLEKEIIIGFPDGTLRLDSELTREQFALILTRFRSYTEKSKN